MVNALHEARRALRPHALLVDARPDSRVLARVEHSDRVVGTIRTQAGERAMDVAADRAVARLKRDGLLRRHRAGRFWHRVPFDGLGALEAYLREHLRFEHRVRWTPAGRRRPARWRDEPLVIVRAIRFELLETIAR